MITRRDIPNLLTILRIVLVAPIVWLLAEQRYGQAMVIFAIAGVTDGLDGYLAKRNEWVTRLGSLLDPLADKLMLLSSYVVLGWTGVLPMWLVLLVLGRDVVIVGGAFAFHFLVGRFDADPMMISKLNTVAQIALVLLVVLGEIVSGLPASVIEAMTFCVVVTTIASGAGYVWSWGKRAYRMASEKRAS